MPEAILNYINIAVGVVGIAVTVLSAPSLLQLGAKVRTEQLPDEFINIGAGIRAIGVCLLLLTFMLILGIGLVLMLLPLASTLGAAKPVLTTVLIVSFLFSGAITLSLGLFHSQLFTPGIVGTFSLICLAFTAGVSNDESMFGGVFGVCSVVFLIAGAIGLVGHFSTNEDVN